MKKLLFVMPSLNAGGGEKALINLLNLISTEYGDFQIDLILFSKRGLFLSQIPKRVNLVDMNPSFNIFTQNIFTSLIKFLFLFKWNLLWHRIGYYLTVNYSKNAAVGEQRSWKHIRNSIDELTSEYDVAIGFLEKSSIYYIVDKVRAKKKIGWIHTTYSLSGLDVDFDAKYFDRLDNIIGVSETCVNDLKNNFPLFTSKIDYVPNVVSKSLISKMASVEEIELNKECSILTIARLSEEKGINLLVDTVLYLKEQGFQFCWYIIGDGHMRSFIESKIAANDLSGQLVLLGLQANPYPYIEACTIYCQPSQYEGKSIAIEEAKLLQKVIVATNYPTVHDQLTHNVTGIIVKQEKADLAQSIIDLSINIELRKKIEHNLAKYTGEEGLVLNKVYSIINI